MRIYSFLFLLLSSFAYSQISGKVVDDTSAANPLEYATAVLYKASNDSIVKGVVTDFNGNYRFTDYANGKYYVALSFIGYQTKKTAVFTVENTNDKINLGTTILQLGDTVLNEIELTGERATVVNKIDRQIYNAAAFSNSKGGTAIDVIQNLPSVTVSGEGEINVRGTSGFSVLLNGKPVQGNVTAILNQLPANAVERVEIITAPSAKYDAEGKAGLINIITKKGATNGAFTQFNVRGGFPSIEDYDNAKTQKRYGIDATYNCVKNKWNIALGASYNRNDLAGRREGDVYTIQNDTLTRFPSDGERSTDEVSYNGRFNVDYTPNENNSFAIGFFAGKRNVDRLADIVYYDNHAITPVESGNRVYTLQYFNHNLRTRTSDFALGSFDYGHTFQNKSKLKTSLLYEYTLLGGPTINQNLGFPNTNFVYQDEYNTNDNPLNGTRFNLDYTFEPFSFGTIEIGYQYRNLLHKGDFIYERKNNTTGIFELIPEFSSQVDLKRTIQSGYVQLSGEHKKWEYSGGVRIENTDRDFRLKDRTNTLDTTYVFKNTQIFPSFALQYSVSENFKVKTAYSKRVERTTTFKMNPFPEREHSETLEQGDPTLLPEFIDVIELGVTQKFKSGNSIFGTGYFRKTQNTINRVNTVYNDTILNRIYSNVGTSKALGLELGATLKTTSKWNNFIGFNVYNYSINGEFDSRNIATKTTVYSINATSTLKFWKTASAQFTYNYLSARNTAQGEDSRFYKPNLTLQKTFLNDRLTATLQWQNIDMGLLNTNEQRITTFRDNEFFTTTNYVYEVDVVVLNLTYTFNNTKNKAKFIKSEFGEREF